MEALSHNHARTIPKKQNVLAPPLKKTGCLGEINSRFLAGVERVLWLGGLPCDPAYPAVCFDLAALHSPSARKSPRPTPRPARWLWEPSACTKNGSACLLWPPLNRSPASVWSTFRPSVPSASTRSCGKLSRPAAPRPRRSAPVQDSLDTHGLSALCETFPPAEAFALAQRFEFFYTPKAASWLSLIET